MDKTVSDRADALAGLIEKKLGVRGAGLEAKLRRAGRSLPGFVRRHAQQIVEAGRLSANPKLMRQVDMAGVERAYRKCESWLNTVDPAERRKDRVLRFLAVNAFNLLAVSAAFIAWLAWSGHL